jgi:hypothetical protein
LALGQEARRLARPSAALWALETAQYRNLTGRDATSEQDAKGEAPDSKLNARLLWLFMPWQSSARNSKLHSTVSP